MPLPERKPHAADLIQRVEAAASKGNVEALASLAREADDQGIDAWILVDDLCSRGSEAAALALVPFVVRQAREVEEALVAQSVAPDRQSVRAELWSALEELALAQLHSAGRRLDRLLDTDDPTVLGVRVLAARGQLAALQGEHERSAALYQRAALLAERMGWWQAATASLGAGGRAAVRAGRPARAAALFGGLRRLESAYGSLRGHALALVDLGEAELSLGDCPAAIQRGVESARLAADCGADDVAGAAHSLALEACLARGALAAAEEARRAADAALAQGLADGRWRGRHELRCAALDLMLGDVQEARRRVERARARCAGADDAVGASLAMLLEARVASAAGQPLPAREAWLRARDGLERAHALGPVLRARLDVAWGWLTLERGEPDPGAASPQDARGAAARRREMAAVAERARAAQAALERSAMRAAALEARLVAALLEASVAPGAAGLAELETCRDEARVLGLLPWRAWAEAAMVRVHVREARWGAATAQARSALEQVAELGRGLGESQRVTLNARFGWLADLAVQAAAGAHGERGADAAALWFEALEARVATTLLHSLGARALRGQGPDQDRRQDEVERCAWARRQVHARLMAERSSGDLSPEARRRREELEQRYAEALRAEQAAQSALERDRDADVRAEHLRPLPASLGELRARLGPDEAYVSYALLRAQAWALVVRRDGARAVLLADGPEATARLRSAVERVSRLDPGTGQPALDGEQAVAAREQLAQCLLGALGLGADVRRLCVCPDAELAFVPWAWIQPGEPALDVALAPSATTLLWLGSREQRPGRGVVALGDPAYPSTLGRGLALARSDRAPDRAQELPIFRPLPYTALEVEAVARAHGDLLLQGAAATEEGLWRGLSSRGTQHRWRSVHLAVHGYVDPAHPALAMLALTPSAREDGLLTVAEILRRDVASDLVVLSACQTGRGELRRGEGLIGLCRAFLVAGAPRVVASLWNVPDDATRLLMEDLYARLDAGTDVATALREAQAGLRATHPDPHAWAGWVLWGLATGPGAAGAR